MKTFIDHASSNGVVEPGNGQHRMAKWTQKRPGNGMSPLLQQNTALTEQESRELELSEKIIKNGWKNFLEVGQALTKIQKNKLYRDKYASFELYCRDRLEISRPYAYNLIGSAEVLEDLSSIEDIPSMPVNEAQTRCLIALSKEKRIAAWKEAVEKAGDDPVTAKLVREVAVTFKQKKAVPAGSNPSAKKRKIGKPIVISLLRMIEEAEEALKIKDFAKAQKILQRMREIFPSKARADFNISNTIVTVKAD